MTGDDKEHDLTHRQWHLHRPLTIVLHT